MTGSQDMVYQWLIKIKNTIIGVLMFNIRLDRFQKKSIFYSSYPIIDIVLLAT